MSESIEETISALHEAIRSFEHQRTIVGDIVVDTAIQVLEKKITELQPVQQRKLATVLMMDIAGHTSIIRDLDPEENMEIIDQALIILQKPIENAGGRVTRFTGDGFKAIFGHPEAHDNDPEMAVRAALDIISTAKEYSKDLKKQRGITGFEVRVGIASGLVLIGGFSEGEDTVKGEAVNLASRLETAAPPGHIYISSDTERLTHGKFDLQTLAPLSLKGFDEPIQAYKVAGILNESFLDTTRGVDWVRTPLVGRTEQLARLDTALSQVVDRNQAQVVTVIAEAGVGKSRLMAEFEDRLSSDIHIFKGRSQREYEETPYAVFRNLFSRLLSIQENFPTDKLPEKFETEIAPILAAGEEGKVRSHFIGNLLGFDFSGSQYLEGVVEDAQQFSDRAWIYLIDYFTNASSDKTCVLLLEDIHWADAQSLDVITHLAHVLNQQQFLVICNARPSLFERRQQWGKLHIAFTNMRLPPLSRRDSRQLIGEILTKAKNIPLILREFIVSGAEGNPFYIEELIKMLMENDVIKKTEAGWQIEQNRLLELEVPPTLTGIVQARLDSLAPLEKSMLQQAAVVGRNFWDGVLFHLNSAENGSEEQARIEQALAALLKKEMIYTRKQGAIAGFREYVIKHAILREVTYETVLKRMRPVYHGLVAEWLIDNGTSSEFTPMIAGHLESAGQPARAAIYLRIAGEQSRKQYANAEAVRHLSRALELLPKHDALERFLVLQTRTQIYSLQGNRQSQKMDISTLADLAKELDEEAKYGEVALLKATFASELSEYNNIIKFSKKAIEHGHASKLPRLIGKGHQLWGRALIAKGEYSEAQTHLDEAINISKTASLSQIEADSLRYLGMVVEQLETTEKAMVTYEKALSIYRRIGDLRGEGWVLKDLGNLKLRRQDLRDEGVAHIKRFHEITNKIGDLLGKGSSIHMLAEASRRQGDLGAASEFLKKALVISTETGNETIEIDSLLELGKIAYEKNKFNEAGKNFSDVLELAKRIGNRRMETIALFEVGRLFHRMGDFVRAMNYYQNASALLEELKNRRSRANVLAYMSLLNNQLNNFSEAVQTTQTALELLEPSRNPTVKAFVLTQLGDAKLGQNLEMEALDAYKQAYALYEDADEKTLSLEPFAGMADVYLQTGDKNSAMKIVEHILESIESAEGRIEDLSDRKQVDLFGLEGTTDPVSIYYKCCKVLASVNDIRASVSLDKLVGIIANQSTLIEEVDQKQAFLTIPLHQTILKMKQNRLIEEKT